MTTIKKNSIFFSVLDADIIKESILLYKRLIPLVIPYWKKILTAFICTIPLSACSAGIAYLIKPALDEVFLKKDITMLYLIPLAIIVIYFLRGLFEYIYGFMLGSVGNRIIANMRNKVYGHIQNLSVGFFAHTPTGYLMSRITHDVNMMQGAINEGVLNIAKETVTAIGLVVVLFVHDPVLACVALLIIPWMLVPIWKFGKKSRKLSTRKQEKTGQIATFLHETIKGYRIVKAFCMEEYEAARFAIENKRLLRIALKRLRIRAMSPPIMEMIGGLAASAVIFYGGYNVITGVSTPGTFFSFVASLLLLYGPAKGISNAYQDVQEGLAAAKRVFDILDTETEVKELKGAARLAYVKGEVEFSEVCFSYGDIPVLFNINLKVSRGEAVAVVGMTGSGKSTLVNLIPRFYDVTSGVLTVDGIDIKNVTLKSLREQISFVSQHPYLFNDTVENNIVYGRYSGKYEKQEVIDAAEAALAHDFIQSLPEGYNTVIGEHGQKLSGGQKQRIALARAFLKNAPIVIFDEATSSLDSEVEAEIQTSLERLVSGRTTFIISHRLSTVRNAHRIIVLSHGEIVEQGSHDVLLSLGGEYSRLYATYFEDLEKSNL